MLQISSGVSKFAMLTIPFFVLAGAIMAEGGMARRLVAFANVIVGLLRLRGGLSLVNIMATTFMSGISGSSVADASAIGSVMIPQMEKSGYPRVFSTNVTISASVQGLLVPPSHNAVIYSLATGGTISIASLFMAGVMPGLLLGASLMLLCVVLAYGTAGYMLIERWDPLDASFMTLITISTVGYEEVHQLSTPGKLFSASLILGGIGAEVTLPDTGRLEATLFGEAPSRFVVSGPAAGLAEMQTFASAPKPRGRLA